MLIVNQRLSPEVHKSTLKELLTLAYPMVISQGAFAVMIFTDRYFMSMVSPSHMAASLGGGVASFFCMSLFIGVLSYTNALVAQYFGRDERDKCSKVLLCYSSSVMSSATCSSLWAILRNRPRLRNSIS